MASPAPAPEALRLPAEPLLAAVDQAAGDRGVSISELLGNTGQKHYAYQRLAIAAAPDRLEPEVTVTAWHQTACARPGCAQPIQPGESVGLVGDVGPCCAPCCGLDRHRPQRATDTITTPPRKERVA
jgi:hypothetical protein